MNKLKGSTLILIGGIIMLIYGGISVILALLSFVGSAIFSGIGKTEFGGFGRAAAGAVMVIGFVLLLAAALNIVIGVLGIRYSNRKDKANVIMVFGIVLGAFSLISFLSRPGFWNFVGLAAPTLFIIGAIFNKQEATAPGATPSAPYQPPSYGGPVQGQGGYGGPVQGQGGYGAPPTQGSYTASTSGTTPPSYSPVGAQAPPIVPSAAAEVPQPQMNFDPETGERIYPEAPPVPDAPQAPVAPPSAPNLNTTFPERSTWSDSPSAAPDQHDAPGAPPQQP